jgi:hypothetical protein
MRIRLTYFQYTVDIEATVRNGALDVGIFAPVEMLDLSAGNDLLTELKAELKGIYE